MGAFFVIIFAYVVKWALVAIVTSINDRPLDSLPFANMIFLMFQRPIFVIAVGLGFTPILLRNPFTYPLTAFLEHSFWYPLARLSYGAYLSACIFMLYRTYNMERGMWACELDAFFLFMAYLSFAYLFSFLITVVIEMPCHNMYDTFILGKSDVLYNRGASTGNSVPPTKIGSGGKRGFKSSIEEDESDAETLDTNDHAESDSHFVSNSASSYKSRVNSTKLISNTTITTSADVSGQRAKTVAFT